MHISAGCKLFTITAYLCLTFDHLLLNYTICYWFNHEKQEKLFWALPDLFKNSVNETPTRQFQKVTVKEQTHFRSTWTDTDGARTAILFWHCLFGKNFPAQFNFKQNWAEIFPIFYRSVKILLKGLPLDSVWVRLVKQKFWDKLDHAWSRWELMVA